MPRCTQVHIESHFVFAYGTFTLSGGALGGTGTLTVDGKQVGTARIARTMGFRISLDETFDVGEDAGEPVSEDYRVPFRFAGTLNRVQVDFK